METAEQYSHQRSRQGTVTTGDVDDPALLWIWQPLWSTTGQNLVTRKVGICYDIAILLLGRYPRELFESVYRGTCAISVTEALASIWMVFKMFIQMFISGSSGISTQWETSQHENALGPIAFTWINSKNIMLNEWSKFKGDKYCMITFL